MQRLNLDPSLIVYNASAGSGKTFSLVKAYLKKILTQQTKGSYKQLLAITFTNKAVAEMKERIIQTLVDLSAKETSQDVQGMLSLLIEETGLTEIQIKKRSKDVLKHLLHNYAQFSVETIDHFNHRLIRTFARDLKLPSNFEVSLEVGALVDEAVDRLIERAGTDAEITEVLLAYALQKTDEDKSWDIALDLKKTAKLLNNENDRKHLEGFETKTLANFKSLQSKLNAKTTHLKKEVSTLATLALEAIRNQQIEPANFLRSTLPNHFLKLTEGNFDVYGNKLEENLHSGGHSLYKKSTDPHIAQNIDSLTPFLLESYLACKSAVFSLRKFENMAKNLVPLATIHLVNKELQLIKEEQNILPISEFNSLIHHQIKDEPAPFIYERLGDRYRHFFIDEFQDTSKLQWLNLQPLIENALAQSYEDGQTGSLLLVGDAKQSIYRWRGGLPEQFIDIYKGDKSFPVSEKSIRNLDTNYRSHQTIVDFNNQFFSYLSDFFDNETHASLYKVGNQQKSTSKQGGYVEIAFLEAENKEEESELYPIKVHQTILGLLDQGYAMRDICILTRRKKEGIYISEYLLAQEPPISVISEETLLLKNDSKVQTLVNMLQLSLHPQNEELQILVLTLLAEYFSIAEDQKHRFFSENVKKPLSVIENTLQTRDIYFSFDVLRSLPLYEAMEYTIEKTNLSSTPDAFLASFMDLVFRFSQRPEVGKNEFLTFWETESEKASIAVQANTDAVSIMTIHKSKGLEFPIVIFPFANLDIYKEIEPTAWYPYKEDDFDELFINYKKEVELYDTFGANLSIQRNQTLELDHFNLLYVTLTRAVQQLYVFANTSKPKTPPTSYNGFFQGYLESIGQWSAASLVYTFGEKEQLIIPKAPMEEMVESSYPVSSPQEHNIDIVISQIAIENEDILASIQFGNVLHDTMSLIEYADQASGVLEDLKATLPDRPDLFAEIEQTILSLITHPELAPLFDPVVQVFNERDILTTKGMMRPDRVVIHPDGTATIVDYKTGDQKTKDILQIRSYAHTMEEMDYPIKELLIVYGNPDGIIVNKV